jgi:hypothetical protein
VTISGSNFGATQGISTVAFNGTEAGAASTWGADEIKINVPAGATSGKITVTTAGGTATSAGDFNVQSSWSDNSDAQWKATGTETAGCDRYETAGKVTLLKLNDDFNSNLLWVAFQTSQILIAGIPGNLREMPVRSM